MATQNPASLQNQALTLKQARKKQTLLKLLAQDWHKAQMKRGKWLPNHTEHLARLELNLLPALSLRDVK